MASPARTTGWTTVALLFLVIATDGYDTASLSFVIPSLAQTWGLAPAAFTFPLVATAIGSVIGYIASGPLTARFGRRWVVLGSVAVFTAGTVATLLATSVTAMGLIRLVTGIGLGVVLPAAVSLAADVVPSSWRDSASIVVTMGMGTGAVVGGFVGAWLIAASGWHAIFWFGGAVSALLFVLLWWRLPDIAVVVPDDAHAHRSQGPRSLFADGTGISTVLLWSFALLVFIVFYTLQSWFPTFLIEYGFSAAQAPLAAAVIPSGAIVGGIVLATVGRRSGAAPALVVTVAVAVACLIATALPFGVAGLLVLLAVAGAGIGGGCVGQLALAIGAYPPHARTTGVGFAAAFGRIGSILGPALGGLLLAAGLPASSIILLLAAPLGLAWIVLVVLARRLGTRPEAPVLSAPRHT